MSRKSEVDMECLMPHSSMMNAVRWVIEVVVVLVAPGRKEQGDTC